MNERLNEAWLHARKRSAGTRISRKTRSALRDLYGTGSMRSGSLCLAGLGLAHVKQRTLMVCSVPKLIDRSADAVLRNLPKGIRRTAAPVACNTASRPPPIKHDTR